MNGKIIALSLAITVHLVLLNIPLSSESSHSEPVKKSKPISITLNQSIPTEKKGIVVPIIKKTAQKNLQSRPIHKKKTVLSHIQKFQKNK